MFLQTNLFYTSANLYFEAVSRPDVQTLHISDFSFSLHMSFLQNKLIIIAAPSGAGKTSVTRHLLKVLPDRLAFSISCATRHPRNNEKDGVDYYFISANDFKHRIEQQEFVEWEMVYEGKYYGTLKSEMNRIWQQKKHHC